MVIRAFPDVSLTDESGLLAAGGDLDVESLLLAYRNGIFPWPVAGDYPLLWFCPPKRAVLFFDRFHVPRRLKKKLRSGRYDFRINASFASVISRCAEANNRKGEKGTWITPEMISAYVALHEAGYCHCIECLLEA
ncbi:MAG TPA: leucyl/phenylalanyl-tRNA--protein transferase, partial [Oligoflexia bacterium]|nr:leucyl/phenylalanyl-tRNA--protein transferase [Oligoflexia bacterium]